MEKKRGKKEHKEIRDEEKKRRSDEEREKMVRKVGEKTRKDYTKVVC